ncbi:phosphatidylinositol N-acetylglucosaminyltransferase subunit Q-like [Micractinium conductrix]|uniref:Phosphatidylinositol N-acetylglucosaminyltransferase subunit Q-like n=1 Tax=Micractinium conductrix TaxID=554055 RepID=A0A2P6V004_9CHLO|nr:phosphatidylinositol N-acetylglucosaminyltransferase subunit Q-like [Micractinium conductrix]|eukprot:PSC67419.1 phosphatidylinositol N-acetylglucosaminyltransferase subunit Q-like [Micractinium conductrix]
MAAQPAGIKLHRQLAELLGLALLQYLTALRAVLAGHASLLMGGGSALVATALLAGGLQRGLAALQALLWVLGLPAAAPYVALAAALRWQLRSTVLMWRVMRGKQQLPPLRKRLALVLQRGSSGSGGPVAAGGGAPGPRAAGLCSFPRSPGSGLKQLSGSMLLFMPLLLLLPTTAWFYSLTLALHAAAAAPRAAAQLATALAEQDPLGAALGQQGAASGSSSGCGGCGASGAGLETRTPNAPEAALAPPLPLPPPTLAIARVLVMQAPTVEERPVGRNPLDTPDEVKRLAGKPSEWDALIQSMGALAVFGGDVSECEDDIGGRLPLDCVWALEGPGWSEGEDMPPRAEVGQENAVGNASASPLSQKQQLGKKPSSSRRRQDARRKVVVVRS